MSDSDWVDVPSDGDWVDAPDESNWVDAPDEPSISDRITSSMPTISNDFRDWFGDNMVSRGMNTVGNVVADAGAGILKSGAGIANEVSPGSANNLIKKVDDFQKENWQDAELTSGSTGEMVAQGASGGVQMLPAIATGPLGALGYFGLTSGGNRAADEALAGTSQDKIDEASLASTGIGAAASLIPGGAKIKIPAVKSLVNALSWAGIPVVMGEGEMLVDKNILDKKLSEDEVFQRRISSIVSGLVGGAMAHGVGKLRRNVDTRPDVEKMMNEPPAPEAPPIEPSIPSGNLLKAYDAVVKHSREPTLGIGERATIEQGLMPNPIEVKQTGMDAGDRAAMLEAFRPKVEPVVLENGQTVPGAVIAPEKPSLKTWVKNIRNPETGIVEAERSLIKEAQQGLAESKAISAEKVAQAKENAPSKNDSVNEPQTNIVDVPVKQVRASEIATKPDLMQFKRSDNTNAGTNKDDALEGKWDDRKAGNLLLWEPTNPQEYGLAPEQRYIVANGHHRFEFGNQAKRFGYNSQIVREADGISVQEARRLAAEINIADGKGTIADQVKFLRESRATLGPDEAVGARERLGKKGRQAATIAYDAAPDLYDSFINEKVTPKQAEAIASAAPGDNGAQRAGIDAVIKKEDIDPVALNILVRGVKDRIKATAGQQGEIFGIDDSAIKEAEDISALLRKKKRALNTQEAVTLGGAIHPDLVNETGVVNVSDSKAAKAKLQEIRAQKDLLSGATTDRAQMSALREELKKQKGGVQEGLFSEKNKQKGSFTLPGEVASAIKGTYDKAKEAVTKPLARRELLKSYDEAVKDGTINAPDEQLNNLEKRLRGQSAPSLAVAKTRKYLIKTLDAARANPDVKTWYDAAWDGMKLSHSTEQDLVDKARPYFDLIDSDRVNKFLLLQRRKAANSDKYGKPITESDANLKSLQFTEPEIKAIKAVRDSMSYAFEKYKSIKVNEANTDAESKIREVKKTLSDLHYKKGKLTAIGDVKKVEAEIARANEKLSKLDSAGNAAAYGVSEQESKLYVPYSRFGKFEVRGVKNGEPEVHFTESLKEAKIKAAEMAKDGYTDIKQEERVDLPSQLYKLPAEFSSVKGFTKHMLPAKLVAGESQNLKRAMADYIGNMARYVGHESTQPKRKAAFESLAAKKNKEVYDWLAKVNKDFESPVGGITKTLKNVAYNTYLRFNPGSALMNMTEQMTVIAPQLKRLNPSKSAIWGMTKGNARAAEWIVKGKISDPEIDAAVRKAIKEGVFQDPLHRDTMETARTGKVRTISKMLPDFFRFTQKINDITTYTAGLEALKAKGLRGEELQREAEYFLNDVRPPSDKLNAPLAMRGAFAIPTTFRGWMVNYLTLLKRTYNEKDFKTAGLMLGTMMSLGGAAGVPLLKDALTALENAGVDVRGTLKRGVPSWLDSLVNYGALGFVPEEMRPNIVNKVSLGNILPEESTKDVPGAIGRAALGVNYDIGAKIAKAIKYGKEGKYQQAAEQVFPQGLIAGTSRAVRATRPDPQNPGKMIGFRDDNNVPLLTKNMEPRDPTLYELGYTAIGLQPSSLGEAYRTKRSVNILRQSDSEAVAKYNKDAAEALYNNDEDGFIKILEQAAEKGVDLNEQSIQERLLAMMTGSELGDIKRASPRIKERVMENYDE